MWGYIVRHGLLGHVFGAQVRIGSWAGIGRCGYRRPPNRAGHRGGRVKVLLILRADRPYIGRRAGRVHNGHGALLHLDVVDINPSAHGVFHINGAAVFFDAHIQHSAADAHCGVRRGHAETFRVLLHNFAGDDAHKALADVALEGGIIALAPEFAHIQTSGVG